MKGIRWFAIVLVTFAILTHCDAVEAKTDLSTKTLEGLENVEVLVEGLDDSMRDAGLTESDLKTRVELRLRAVGIQVVEECGEPRYATLYVNVNALLPAEIDRAFYSYEVSLAQAVYTTTKPQRWIAGATTWHKGGIGTTARTKFRDTVLDAVALQVDAFANAFLTMNPPAPKGK